MTPHPAPWDGVELVVPATSANLGPAFDCAALALSLHLRVAARTAAGFSLQASGRDAVVCGSLENNLMLCTYSDVLTGAGRPVAPLSLAIHNEIPVGKGCGSSAAARIAGILLANHYGQLGWSRERMLVEAALREGHPDNSAACLFGGLVIAHTHRPNEPPSVVRVTINRTARWQFLVVVPPAKLPTEQARRILPTSVPRADAVDNIGNAMLLVVAFQRGRAELLPDALQDRLHQPYRQRLCPLLTSLQPLAGQRAVFGVALSGAGPSVLLVADGDAPQASLLSTVESRLHEDGLDAELLFAKVAPAAKLTRRHA